MKSLIFILMPAFIGAFASAQSVSSGILLEGPRNSLAVSVLMDYQAKRSNSDLEVARGPNGTLYYKTQLLGSISKKATIGQVNAALASVHGRIVVMYKDNAVITIQVPDPGSPEKLDKIASQLDSTGVIVGAVKMYVVQPMGN